MWSRRVQVKWKSLGATLSEAYEAVGLVTHPKKSKRRARVFHAWGAHFEGDAATVGMDREKLAALSAETAGFAAGTLASEHLLQKVLGLWAFAFQFRRPLFSIFQECYRVGHPTAKIVSPSECF